MGSWVDGSWHCSRRGGGNGDYLGEMFGPAESQAAEGGGVLAPKQVVVSSAHLIEG